VAGALEETAFLLADQDAATGWERAARLLGSAEALRHAANSPLPPPERAQLDQLQAVVRSALGDAAFRAAWAAGQSLTLEQAAAEAMQALGNEVGIPSHSQD
jgi:hypothetical protein